MKLSSFAYSLTLGISFGLLAQPAYCASITIDPSKSSINPNTNFSVDISIESIVDLYAFQFDFDFTPNLLTVSNILPGTFLSDGSGFLPGFIDNNVGKISFIGDTLIGPVSGKSGSGVLATIEFTSVSPGIANLFVENTIFLDSNLQDINEVSNRTSSVKIVNDEVPVPEPSSAGASAIIIAGLLGRWCYKNLQRSR
jgi:hypothetical protein